MSHNGSRTDRRQPSHGTERVAPWEGAGSRSASEVLAILEPADDEPRTILTMGFWKSGGVDVPDLQAAAS